MKAAPFGYQRAGSVAEAVALLAADPDSKLMAGAQSLGPMLNLRLARPSTIVDISGLDSLRYVVHDGRQLRIGALTRHATVEHYPGVLTGFEVIRDACRQIGYPPIRENGTVGGSLAHADPTAEWCLVSVLLGAEVVLSGPGGNRRLPITEFLRAPFMTAAGEAEMIVEVCFPQPYERTAFREVARQDGDFALVAASVAFDLGQEQVVESRVAVAGLSGVPMRLPDVEDALSGRAVEDHSDLDKPRLTVALREAASRSRSDHVVGVAAELIQRCVRDALRAGPTDGKAGWSRGGARG